MIGYITDWTFSCDSCDWMDNTNEHSSSNLTRQQALKLMREQGWEITRDGKTYCPDCRKTKRQKD